MPNTLLIRSLDAQYIALSDQCVIYARSPRTPLILRQMPRTVIKLCYRELCYRDDSHSIETLARTRGAEGHCSVVILNNFLVLGLYLHYNNTTRIAFPVSSNDNTGILSSPL